MGTKSERNLPIDTQGNLEKYSTIDHRELRLKSNQPRFIIGDLEFMDSELFFEIRAHVVVSENVIEDGSHVTKRWKVPIVKRIDYLVKQKDQERLQLWKDSMIMFMQECTKIHKLYTPVEGMEDSFGKPLDIEFKW